MFSSFFLQRDEDAKREAKEKKEKDDPRTFQQNQWLRRSLSRHSLVVSHSTV